MRRFIRYDHLGNVLGEISANDIMSLIRREEINGVHSLTVTTLQVLNKNERIVYQDGRGVWREYVVSGVDEEHAAGNRVVGTYFCVWSVQQDLLGVPVSVMPGVQTPTAAGNALTAALSSQARWARGTVTNTTISGASMYDINAWNALKILVENWGGELSTTIGVSSTGVVTRAVDLYEKQGEQTAKRRFDFGDDLASVKRTFADEPFYCRISPRGKGEQTADGGYGRKITIESVNGGRDYLEYAPMVDVCKLPDGNSGFQYPTLQIENSNCETPAELLAWAQSVLEEYCTPKVTYNVNVIQAAVEGVDVQGVSLGDAVQVVDKHFNEEGLRITGRVTATTVDELNEREIAVTIGYIGDNLASKFSTAIKSVTELEQTLSTAEYIQNLLDRINAEINATGGYTYITQGQGIRTYDTDVSDPLVGSEASKVVEIKGGSVRIANSKTAQGEWEWKSVFTSGEISTEVLNATNIVTGLIQDAANRLNPGSGNYWNLDTGMLHTVSGEIGGFTISNSSLHNGLTSLLDTLHSGVYLGTSGLATGNYESNVSVLLVLEDGAVKGYRNGTLLGTISPTLAVIDVDGQGQQITVHGIDIAGSAVALSTDSVFVKASNNEMHPGVSANPSYDVIIPRSYSEWEDFEYSDDDPDEPTINMNPLYLKLKSISRVHHKGITTHDNTISGTNQIGFYSHEQVDNLLSKKVSAESGKGLSSNDFTTALKNKLDGIEPGAQVNPNLSGYATISYVQGIFSLQGTTLTITTTQAAS